MKITFKINDKTVEARTGWTVLETAQHYGIDIPTLCHHESVTPSGACRLCMVELKEGNWSKLVASCIYPVKEGITIYTETERVSNVRRWVFEMLLSTCPASAKIRQMAANYGVASTRFPISNPDNKCMVCGLCSRVCEEVVGLSAISVVDRGVHKKIGAPFLRPTDVCVACGCCVSVCPTGAMQSFFDQVRGEPSMRLTQLTRQSAQEVKTS
ncbi:MAG: 2Fe-2S iron-sulfur cluster binding domain-containing protein [Desulfobacteraceae bacterium]|nr:2Fe-2S iron-sulfur cluster binding domain-containing protein [Desulfobacteraceae bacterium]